MFHWFYTQKGKGHKAGGSFDGDLQVIHIHDWQTEYMFVHLNNSTRRVDMVLV